MGGFNFQDYNLPPESDVGAALLDQNGIPVGSTGTPVPQQPSAGGVAFTAPAATGPADPYRDAVMARIQGQPSAEQLALLQASQPVVGKAGSTSSSTTSQTSGMQVSPESRAASEAALGAKQEAAHAREVSGELQAGAAADAATAAEHKAAELESYNADTAAKQDAHALRMQELEAGQQKDSEAYAKAAKTLDPARLLNSGGNRVLAAISMALGSFGASITKSQNYAMQIINDALDRDYQGQRDVVSAAKDKQTLSQQAVQNARAKFQDESAQRANYRGDMLSALAAHQEAVAMKHAGGIAKQLGTEKGLDLNAEAVAEYAKARALENRTVSSSTTTQRSAPVAPTYADQVAQLKAAAEAKLSADKAFGPHAGVSESDQTYANKVREKLAAFGDVIQQGGALRDLNDKTTALGSMTGLSDDAKRRNVQEAAVLGPLVRAQTGATATDSETAREKQALTGDAWTNSGKNVGLDQRMGTIATKLHAELGQMHPKLREEAVARMRTAFPPQVVDAILTGKAPENWFQNAGSLGGKVRE